MKITKYGHCCLLVEEKGVRLLTDPGAFTADTHTNLTALDVILYTHEHADHFHLDSLRLLRQNNPGAIVICNEGVSSFLEAEGIPHTKIINDTHEYNGVTITGISGEHEEIYPTIPRIQNTGYLIAQKLWYPGDSFVNPGMPVDVLALPVAGPWLKLSEALDYAVMLKPQKVLYVHDWILSPSGQSVTERVAKSILSAYPISLFSLTLGETYDF